MVKYSLALAWTVLQCTLLVDTARGFAVPRQNKIWTPRKTTSFSPLWSTTTEASSTEQEVITTTKKRANDELGGCTVGDTKGACLLLEDVAISRGVNQIIKTVDWRIERGERWGIVGPNGAGKVGVSFCLFFVCFVFFKTYYITFENPCKICLDHSSLSCTAFETSKSVRLYLFMSFVILTI